MLCCVVLWNFFFWFLKKNVPLLFFCFLPSHFPFIPSSCIIKKKLVNFAFISKEPTSIKSTGKMRGKRSENCISFSLPPFKEGCFNKEKERTKGSVERALSSVTCARVFVSVLRVVLPTIESGKFSFFFCVCF